LTRSGANTVSELAAVALPAVYIPLPQAHNDEQRLNAEAVVNQGAGLLLLQKDASVDTVIDAVSTLKKKARSMKRHAEAAQNVSPINATTKLYELVQELANA
jgi:UDP-N-acetylglucosamine--N-acetylmuramyl-(pentapeptide) pyrophosphoryl-undecaprenol N-acetylglucosamine transferase